MHDARGSDEASDAGLTRAAYLRTLLLAAVLGAPIAMAAVLFQTALHHATQLVWEEIPDGFGWNEPAAWYVVLVTALAGQLVAAAVRLRGHGGRRPLEVSAWAPCGHATS